MLLRIFSVMGVLLLVSGCYGWKPVQEERVTGPDGAYTVVLPVGWMLEQTPRPKNITVSRDGVLVQNIRISRQSHQEAFFDIKRESSGDMLPSEIAELVVAALKATSGLENVEVLGSTPARIDARNGFRLHLGYRNPKGLRYERLIYGFADGEALYTLTYQAPTLHYFARDLEVFEGVVQSFRLGSG